MCEFYHLRVAKPRLVELYPPEIAATYGAAHHQKALVSLWFNTQAIHFNLDLYICPVFFVRPGGNMSIEAKEYRAFHARNFRSLPQVQERLTDADCKVIDVVSQVLPFKTSSYVADELIDWDKWETDPMFTLTFPRKGMLMGSHYKQVENLMDSGADKKVLREAINTIRMELNPHPAGQMEHNVPELDGQKLTGIQHKYKETCLFFPQQGQTCHAYCSFCFRWPQFVGMSGMKFAMKEGATLRRYVEEHPEISDVLFTGGDPMVMKADIFNGYVDGLLENGGPENLQTVRIGSKALSYSPYRFVTDSDADEMLFAFEKIIKSGRHVSFMAHFNHPVELSTPAVKEAIRRIRDTGAQIRSQSPLLAGINDSSDTWATMWREQVKLGVIPYYMFLSRDTGAQHYFAVPLEKAHDIFRGAYNQVSGVCRTVRGPSMSAGPGKVQVLGVTEVAGEKVFALRFLQGRDPEWVHKPFFAKYDPQAIWLDDLEPAFGEKQFFFEEKFEMAF